jgi:hypothetical protein
MTSPTPKSTTNPSGPLNLKNRRARAGRSPYPKNVSPYSVVLHRRQHRRHVLPRLKRSLASPSAPCSGDFRYAGVDIARFFPEWGKLA